MRRKRSSRRHGMVIRAFVGFSSLPVMHFTRILAAFFVSTMAASVHAQLGGTVAPGALENGTEQAAPMNAEQVVDPCGPRIRKSWDRLTPMEKDVYIRALERSMDDGLYIKFVEIHTEQMTTAEAHRTCMFLYWHRLLLLGFENMLRAYGGEYACITIPYWDYVAHNSRFLRGQCTSMEDCAPILQELGGSSRGQTTSVTVNGTPVQGTCVTSRPVNHFCEASHLSGRDCARCVPRGDWTQAAFPGTTSVSSLMRQLFSSPTIDAVATNLERGIHNTIHNALDGVMGVLEAPADPIFWSHHAAIDLLHSIFYHCAVGNTESMSLENKLADPRQYVQCARRSPLSVRQAVDRNVLLPQSEVTLRSGENGMMPQSVRDPRNPLSPAFALLPTEYLGLSDIRDIGAFSYNYEMSGELAGMFTTCADLTTLLGDAPRVAARGPFAGGVGGVRGFNGGLRRLENQAGSSLLEAVIVQNEQSTADTASDWYRTALRAALTAANGVAASNPSVSPTSLALREVEKMTCMFYDECRGHVADFSVAFRASFHTNASTPCFAVVDSIKNGRDTLLVANWKELMLQFFSC